MVASQKDLGIIPDSDFVLEPGYLTSLAETAIFLQHYRVLFDVLVQLIEG